MIGVDTFYRDKYFDLPPNSSAYATPSYQLLGVRVSHCYELWGLQFTLNDPRIIGLRMKWTLQ